ncbi:phosphate transporter [Candidatus Kaiserbacteria bacterium RIFCSPHIGHO2_01_FULL_53_29]|uniref:Phosphate transporter n=1 Tax=Candidatus Kaiserbacteria bacterium RIFCSPHIGHO2_01_FULL_53_29 TaxID=1798480 RepID=A0A1F6CX48_9BACT|nr:MAG: phosphate transporter [Candidatus Kaiserbacteria bacterium RIFCSPHIGHO2_01_FULL_53_29]
MILIVLLCIALLLVLAAEFINGWTDAPNAIATVVATGVLPLSIAVPMAVLLNIAGALSGTAVAATIGKGIVTTESVTIPAIAAAMISIIGWGIFAAYRGLPISKSHALVAGLAGAAIAGGGFDSLLWAGWEKILIGMALSVIAGFGIAFLIGKTVIALAASASPARAKIGFDVAHIFTAGTMAFAHGLNDGQKFIGIFTLVLVLSGHVQGFNIPWWVIILCGLTMGLGTSLGGWRIIATIGKRMVKIQSWQGFAATSAASSTIIVASVFGVPLSTTHTITTAIAGASSSRRVGDVKWGVLGSVVRGWLLTFPICGALAFVAAFLANHAFLS